MDGSRASGIGHPVCEDVDQKGLLVHAFETCPAGEPLQEQHSETPPVRCGGNASGDRFGCHVARIFKRRDDVEVKLGEPCRAEAGDGEIERVARSHQNDAGPEIAVAQAALGKSVECPPELFDHGPKGAGVFWRHRQSGKIAAPQLFRDLERAVLPTTRCDDFGNVVARQPAHRLVHSWVRFGACCVEREYGLAAVGDSDREIPLTERAGCGQAGIQLPAFHDGGLIARRPLDGRHIHSGGWRRDHSFANRTDQIACCYDMSVGTCVRAAGAGGVVGGGGTGEPCSRISTSERSQPQVPPSLVPSQ